MDLVSAISGLQQSSVLSQIDVAVAGKLLDNRRLQGNSAEQLLQSAASITSSAGDAVNNAVASTLGSQIDTYA